ncbi:MAG: MBL fold metallo-hydrolase [Caldisericaceae bacterium]|nr:MBL fold metallo-hydrolase [Caldisericaceae bacterium]
MILTTLYDNVSLNPQSSLKEDWGFSLFVQEDGYSILFDTGANGDILLHNAKTLSVSFPNKIFISHFHSDHTGGLTTILKKDSIVYYPYSSFDLSETLQKAGVNSVKINDTLEIYPNVYSTGVLPFRSAVNEQALVFQKSNGLILIVGCSHPGIQNIVDFVTDKFGKSIFLLIGGFHLLGRNRWRIRGIAENLLEKVNYIAPSHCTGEAAKKIFKDVFKERFIQNGVGRTIEIKDERLNIKQ